MQGRLKSWGLLPRWVDFMDKTMMQMKRNAEEVREQALRQARADRAVLAAQVDERVLEILERRFETRLPVFRGAAGQFDPLDAMRRDAYREVVLWLREQAELGRKEAL